MSHPKNPFIYGPPVPPTQFIGRQDSIDLIFDRIYGIGRASVAIWGDCRIGKTSLLHYLAYTAYTAQTSPQRQPANGPHHIVFVDCKALGSFSQRNFWELIADNLEFSETAESWGLQLRELVDQDKLSDRDLRRFFRKMQRGGETLTLLLDEFSHLVALGRRDSNRNLRDLLDLLRILITELVPTSPHPRPLALVVATRRPLDEVCRPLYPKDIGSPFHNTFVFERLKPFLVKEIYDLIELKLGGTPDAFTVPDVQKIISTVGRHPILVQAYASELLRAKRDKNSPTRSTLLNRAFLDRNEQHFRNLWDYSNTFEQRYLSLAAQEQLHTMTWTASETSTHTHLLERGILEYTSDRNNTELFSPLFADWLRRNIHRLQQEQLPSNLSSSSGPIQDLATLRRTLVAQLSLSELRTIAFDLGLNYETLGGEETIDDKTVALLDWGSKNNRINDIYQLAHDLYPHAF